MFSTKGDLNIHIKMRHEKPGFECEICGEKFNKNFCLQRHKKVHDKNRPKPLKCKRCDFATDIPPSYNTHQKFHENQDKILTTMTNPLKCEKCPKFCRNKQAMRLHLRYVHPEVTFQCDLCGTYVKVKAALKQHLLSHFRSQKY